MPRPCSSAGHSKLWPLRGSQSSRSVSGRPPGRLGAKTQPPVAARQASPPRPAPKKKYGWWTWTWAKMSSPPAIHLTFQITCWPYPTNLLACKTRISVSTSLFWTPRFTCSIKGRHIICKPSQTQPPIRSSWQESKGFGGCLCLSETIGVRVILPSWQSFSLVSSQFLRIFEMGYPDHSGSCHFGICWTCNLVWYSLIHFSAATTLPNPANPHAKRLTTPMMSMLRLRVASEGPTPKWSM